AGDRALASTRVGADRPIWNNEAEGGADGAVAQRDLSIMGTHQLGHDREAEPDAAGAGRTLERLEQVSARLLGQSRAGVRDLDHRHRTLAPAGDADLVTAGIPGL